MAMPSESEQKTKWIHSAHKIVINAQKKWEKVNKLWHLVWMKHTTMNAAGCCRLDCICQMRRHTRSFCPSCIPFKIHSTVGHLIKKGNIMRMDKAPTEQHMQESMRVFLLVLLIKDINENDKRLVSSRNSQKLFPSH